MNADIHDHVTLEAAAEGKFGQKLKIMKLIAHDIPTSHTTKASVFLTSKNQVYAYIYGRAPLTLGDVRKIVKQMGLHAEAYLPPAHQPQYFNDVALEKFKSVYPGRHHVSDADLRYYRLSSPYNPALVHIDSVIDGTIKQFDANDSSNWRVATKYSYKRIKTT